MIRVINLTPQVDMLVVNPAESRDRRSPTLHTKSWKCLNKFALDKKCLCKNL
jgi:hypothetical protein